MGNKSIGRKPCGFWKKIIVKNGFCYQQISHFAATPKYCNPQMASFETTMMSFINNKK
jgi:hypothetical protein